MRAREFTINIPINVKIDGDSDPKIVLSPQPNALPADVPAQEEEPVSDNTGKFVPPLQQKIELLKKSTGVKSVFDQEAEDDEPLE